HIVDIMGKYIANNNDRENDTYFGNKRVLLVEDNRINSEFCIEILESLGLRVVAAAHGRQAVDIFIKDQDFAAIIMDCQMPVMDGYEATGALHKIIADHGYKHVPIIALTANVMRGDREKCIKA